MLCIVRRDVENALRLRQMEDACLPVTPREKPLRRELYICLLCREAAVLPEILRPIPISLMPDSAVFRSIYSMAQKISENIFERVIDF
jgi:hypothetical protein